jgi:hypothetical protein
VRTVPRDQNPRKTHLSRRENSHDRNHRKFPTTARIGRLSHASTPKRTRIEGRRSAPEAQTYSRELVGAEARLLCLRIHGMDLAPAAGALVSATSEPGAYPAARRRT